MRSFIALLTVLFLYPIAAYGQSGEFPPSERQPVRTDNRMLAARAIELLKILEREVIVYDSLGDFQDSGKLAKVSFEVFKRDLDKVLAEVEGLLSLLPQGRLKNEIRNSLYSYEDGAFWWEKIVPTQVVNVSHLVSAEASASAGDRHYAATIPYTVAINWRHGANYLKRAQKLLE